MSVYTHGYDVASQDPEGSHAGMVMLCKPRNMKKQCDNCINLVQCLTDKTVGGQKFLASKKEAESAGIIVSEDILELVVSREVDSMLNNSSGIDWKKVAVVLGCSGPFQ